MVWVIVKVEHGDADKVSIETQKTKEEMLNRVKDLINMVKEMDDQIIEENFSDDCDCGNCDNWWWNITFADNLLVTIDAKLI